MIYFESINSNREAVAKLPCYMFTYLPASLSEFIPESFNLEELQLNQLYINKATGVAPSGLGGFILYMLRISSLTMALMS